MRRILSSTTTSTTARTITVFAALAALALTACGGVADPAADAAVRTTTTEAVQPAATTPEHQVSPTTATTQPPTTAAPSTTTAPPTVPPPTTAAAPVPVPVPEPTAPPVVATYVVVDVIDGDTLDLDNGERVRLVGIDAPEHGACGADAATATLAGMTLGKAVVLEPSDEDRDRYGRLLRYVVVDGVDAGGTLLALGQAVPRYNSTDGYGRHPREDEYVAIAQPATTCAAPAPTPAAAPAPAPAPAPSASYQNCDAVRAAGAAPIVAGDPGFQSKFDRDGDGVGCE